MKIELENNKKRRGLIIGCLIFAAVLMIVIVGAEIVTGVSGRKIDTSEGLEILRQAENADVAAIETKIQKLEAKEITGEEDTRSLKERFASTVIFGDTITEGFVEYDVLNASSVISGAGMEWKEQLNKLREVNPKVVFVSYCVDDIVNYEGEMKAYIKEYRKRIEAIQKAVPETSIFVSSFLPVQTSVVKDKPQYKKLEEYNEALEEMCDKMQIGYADNSVLNTAQYYEEDGIHFNSLFYPIWAERMAEVASL